MATFRLLLAPCILLTLAGAASAQYFSPAPGSGFPAGIGPISVVVGDFNGDGKPDLAFANETSSVVSTVVSTVNVFLGDGRGGFAAAPGSPFPVGVSPDSVAVGDFNRDGKLDLSITAPPPVQPPT
jgi:hypothetical protein